MTEPPSSPSETPPSHISNDSAPQNSNRNGLNPHLVHTPRTERQLLATKGQQPIGTRRRRAALATSPNIPFSQLPYQCFQEARRILRDDREEKLAAIVKVRERIARLEEKGDGEVRERHRLMSLRRRLEGLKIAADSNDPLVKKRFEDGDADMSKPIYRHLSHQHWANYKRKLLLQRITQMNVIPDVLPHIDPSVNTTLTFSHPENQPKKIQHGDFVSSKLSETPPSLNIQSYDKNEMKLITVAVVTPDIPNVEKDGFDYRCHFLASNIPISPTQTSVDLFTLNEETQLILPWLPPYSQKGAPYQRLCIFILSQHARLDIPTLKTSAPRYTIRENFILRSFMDKYHFFPIGVDLFRSRWDEDTADVMRRAGVVGGDVEFRRKRVEPLPYRRLKEERYR